MVGRGERMKCRHSFRSSGFLSRRSSQSRLGQLSQRFLSLAAPLLCCLLALGFQPTFARADSSVVVLGVRSLDGDDEFARRVSQSLRGSAKQIKAWKISDRDISLAQMSLAHGCDEPDARCMADIASTLTVDRLVYGTVLRRDGNVEVALFNFDAVTGQIESWINETIPADSLEGNALKATTGGLARRLGGMDVTGALRVRSQAVGAQVILDGKPVGVIDEKGGLLLAGLAVGPHSLTLKKDDASAQRAVEIKEAETTTTEVSLAATTPIVPAKDDGDELTSPGTPSTGMSTRRIFGYSTVGLAGVMAVATVYTWVRIGSINKDPDLRNYRAQFGPRDDVCHKADEYALSTTMAGLEASARKLCHEADTLEVLQYVFLGGAIVAGGIGTYLLLTDKAPKAKLSVRLQPSFARGRSELTAIMRF